jgi:menaquinone-dependent protoporphyrinogen oxidase
MENKVLVAFASRYGSTREVAEAIAVQLSEQGFAVDLRHLRDVKTLDPYGPVVIGAPLFMFHWHKDALNFLSRHRQEIMKRRAAVFVLGPVHDPHDEAEWQSSRAQLEKELARVPWFKPEVLEMVGGKYDPAALGFPLKLFAGEEPASDIRDWNAIHAWADALPEKLR